MTARRQIPVYRDLLEADGEWAGESRRLLQAHGVRMVNLIGSPGCGKTRLLEATAKQAGAGLRLAVLEADVATTRDAERLAAAGLRVSQLITDGACHVSARLLHAGLRDLPLPELDVVVVENVGNLVCPAEFDIGEDAKVAVLSVAEGEDKPLKYPLLFRDARLVVLTKIDLLPHLEVDLGLCLEAIRRINPTVPVLQTSARDGRGVAEWCAWLGGQRR